jgi:hypothetical protein
MRFAYIGASSLMADCEAQFEVVTSRHDLEATKSIVARQVAHIAIEKNGEPLSRPRQIIDRTANLGIPLPLFETRIRAAEAAAQVRAAIHNKLHEPIGD